MKTTTRGVALAATAAAVIFFFGQGQLLGHPEGPIEVAVPKAEFASVLA